MAETDLDRREKMGEQKAGDPAALWTQFDVARAWAKTIRAPRRMGGATARGG